MNATIKIEVDFNGKSQGELVIKNASGSIPPSQQSPDHLMSLIASKLTSIGGVTFQRSIRKAAPKKKAKDS